ncbi:diadenylate cyclase [Thermococcus bergensis]|uniref:DNA integrity scanning protein DisA nucleotide-binding domain protein n=1 Tax=Thermococcus bergensis TaxID=2689387 RepID=UPI001CECD3B8|nr:diadenylate cyclase [Thermococcus bergensis]MCA6212865.1 diadenylate cyclase [Thermococcus bergensis]
MQENNYAEVLLTKALELTKLLDIKALVIIGIELKKPPKINIPILLVGKETNKQRRFKVLPLPLSLGTKNLVNLASSFMIAEGIIKEGEAFIYVTPFTLGIRKARKAVEVKDEFFSQIEHIFQEVLELAIELSLEGREGKPVGTIFVIGDTKNVIKYSHQMVPNPFKGYKINIFDKESKEIIKEFAFLDGAFVISRSGRVLCAGRYLDIDFKKVTVNIPSGLGSRHLAAAGISKVTKAIAITVSESGIVRVFKDGKIIFEYNPRLH